MFFHEENIGGSPEEIAYESARIAYSRELQNIKSEILKVVDVLYVADNALEIIVGYNKFIDAAVKLIAAARNHTSKFADTKQIEKEIIAQIYSTVSSLNVRISFFDSTTELATEFEATFVHLERYAQAEFELLTYLESLESTGVTADSLTEEQKKRIQILFFSLRFSEATLLIPQLYNRVNKLREQNEIVKEALSETNFSDSQRDVSNDTAFLGWWQNIINTSLIFEEKQVLLHDQFIKLRAKDDLNDKELEMLVAIKKTVEEMRLFLINKKVKKNGLSSDEISSGKTQPFKDTYTIIFFEAQNKRLSDYLGYIDNKIILENNKKEQQKKAVVKEAIELPTRPPEGTQQSFEPYYYKLLIYLIHTKGRQDAVAEFMEIANTVIGRFLDDNTIAPEYFALAAVLGDFSKTTQKSDMYAHAHKFESILQELESIRSDTELLYLLLEKSKFLYSFRQMELSAVEDTGKSGRRSFCSDPERVAARSSVKANNFSVRTFRWLFDSNRRAGINDEPGKEATGYRFGRLLLAFSKAFPDLVYQWESKKEDWMNESGLTRVELNDIASTVNGSTTTLDNFLSSNYGSFVESFKDDGQTKEKIMNYVMLRVLVHIERLKKDPNTKLKYWNRSVQGGAMEEVTFSPELISLIQSDFSESEMSLFKKLLENVQTVSGFGQYYFQFLFAMGYTPGGGPNELPTYKGKNLLTEMYNRYKELEHPNPISPIEIFLWDDYPETNIKANNIMEAQLLTRVVFAEEMKMVPTQRISGSLNKGRSWYVGIYPSTYESWVLYTDDTKGPDQEVVDMQVTLDGKKVVDPFIQQILDVPAGLDYHKMPSKEISEKLLENFATLLKDGKTGVSSLKTNESAMNWELIGDYILNYITRMFYILHKSGASDYLIRDFLADIRKLIEELANIDISMKPGVVGEPLAYTTLEVNGKHIERTTGYTLKDYLLNRLPKISKNPFVRLTPWPGIEVAVIENYDLDPAKHTSLDQRVPVRQRNGTGLFNMADLNILKNLTINARRAQRLLSDPKYRKFAEHARESVAGSSKAKQDAAAPKE